MEEEIKEQKKCKQCKKLSTYYTKKQKVCRSCGFVEDRNDN